MDYQIRKGCNENMTFSPELQPFAFNKLHPQVAEINLTEIDLKNDLNNSQTIDKAPPTAMTTSHVSLLDDSTPSDSGVQLLDSVSTDMNESLMSNSGCDYDFGKPIELAQDIDEPSTQNNNETIILTKSDIDNSNVCLPIGGKNDNFPVISMPDEMMTSTGSTFDTENIVYRRKGKKGRNHSTSSQNGGKKRVSFHEDILKNTRTDNIHIEHGFVTYKGVPVKCIPTNQSGARYSWCAEGDRKYSNDQALYRNACSDVLDYGRITGDMIIQKNPNCNSGIFEYSIRPSGVDPSRSITGNNLYKCSCSDSNSSLEDSSSDSDGNKKPTARNNYAQSKSSSCDCIGMNRGEIVIPTEMCYFSEPNIDNLDESMPPQPRSVWSKEKKPKMSCLKKGRHSSIIQEYELPPRVKRFNVHPLTDMNQLLDNSKTILGSLKNIFTMPLPERGVPEGCEDLQSVYECIPAEQECMPAISPIKPRPFLSKSFDGGLSKGDPVGQKNKFIHNVDEQLRRKNDADLFLPSRKNSDEDEDDFEAIVTETTHETVVPIVTDTAVPYRNKYIVNCVSTVYEHTGISYETNDSEEVTLIQPAYSPPVVTASPASSNQKPAPLRQRIFNMIKTFTDPVSSQRNVSNSNTVSAPNPIDCPIKIKAPIYDSSMSISDDNSIISSQSSSIDRAEQCSPSIDPFKNLTSPAKSRHLASPRKQSVTTRYDRTTVFTTEQNRNVHKSAVEDFDDILTITTCSESTDQQSDTDIVMIDYQEALATSEDLLAGGGNFLKPPATSKSSLINRFLRNVTQRKILDATVKKNVAISDTAKFDRKERKLCSQLYVKGVQPNAELNDDLNAEIALEIEMSGSGGIAARFQSIIEPTRKQEFGIGVGEVSVDIFDRSTLHILRDSTEILMKVFKLYTGYSLAGHMTPVLVFLTDKTLYVTDLIRNRLCNKFVLPYSELDVILIGPHGNTVLLSNGARDMQQVLLAGGPYPADGLVSSLEMCARRSGATLPAIGQLTLDHLAPLQAFVRENSMVSKCDAWVYYAVVSVPANILNHEEEPLGPHAKGPLMHRSVPYGGGFGRSQQQAAQYWRAGYFLLKAGVLYMFNDDHHKLPTLAVALSECKGVRRVMTTARPHCFEILLKTGFMQFAAPDEYVASEWLQALVQSASGLFEMQERHKTLGCTLVMTSNHLITLREDFTAPLRRVNAITTIGKGSVSSNRHESLRKLSNATFDSTGSEIRSNQSTPTKLSDSRLSSTKSSPARSLSQSINSSLMGCRVYGPRRMLDDKSFTSMSSIYGKNSGLEVKTCVQLEEMLTIRIPGQSDQWWCILEFSCQEVRENSDDMVIFFATNSDLRRFLTMLETLWHTKKDIPFPISVLAADDPIGQHCMELFSDQNKSWEPLLTAALGYPQ